MNLEQIKKYLDSAKIKVVEEYNFEKKKVKYSDKLTWWNIEKFRWSEEIVRAYILTKLVNELWYRIENIEIEKQYTIKWWHNKLNPRIDVLVKDEHNNPFLFIELKAPEKFEEDKKTIEWQLFELADREEKAYKTKISHLVYYTVDEIAWELADNFILIDRSEIKEYKDWIDLWSISHASELPANYWKPAKEPLKKWDLKTLDKENLSKIRTKIHNTLWSSWVDDNEAYLFLVKYILTKIYDEQNSTAKDDLTCQIYDSDFKNEKELFDRINKRYFEALKNKLNYIEKDLEATWKILSQENIPLKSLYFLVEALEKFSFSKSLKEQKEDILWAFFEETNREKFKQSKWQFFTHTTITKFLIYWLEIDKLAKDLFNEEKRLPYVIDPSTWSWTFLIETMKVITKEFKNIDLEDLTEEELSTYEKFFPRSKPNTWAEDFLYWIDNSYSLAISTKVNMILHWDGSSKIIKNDWIVNFQAYKNIDKSILSKYKKSDPNIYWKSDWDFLVTENFDIILSNPPFSVNPIEDEKEREKHFLFWNKKNSENLFIERYYQLLKPKWRLWVVLPESVFDTTENKYIRLFIYKYFDLKAVVSLPQVAFEPFTSTKTSILFAQKKTKKQIEIWNKTWLEKAKIFSELKTSVLDYLKYFVAWQKLNKTWASYVIDKIENKKIDKIKEDIYYFLKDYIEEDDKKLEIKELLEKYTSEIEALSKFDKSLVWILVTEYRENEWWVFGEVSKALNYEIFMAEVENVGYKRTKRWEKSMPNELFRLDEKWEIILDDWVLETALDYMRKEVNWD